MTEYLLGPAPGGTIHVSADCSSARRCSHLVRVTSSHPPQVVWDLLWSNHHVVTGLADDLLWAPHELPVLGDSARILGSLGLVQGPVDQAGYGTRRWGCLHCLEGAAIAAGWVNTWPADPNRRHR